MHCKCWWTLWWGADGHTLSGAGLQNSLYGFTLYGAISSFVWGMRHGKMLTIAVSVPTVSAKQIICIHAVVRRSITADESADTWTMVVDGSMVIRGGVKQGRILQVIAIVLPLLWTRGVAIVVRWFVRRSWTMGRRRTLVGRGSGVWIKPIQMDNVA